MGLLDRLLGRGKKEEPEKAATPTVAESEAAQARREQLAMREAREAQQLESQRLEKLAEEERARLASAAGAERVYVVKSGDSLSKIAKEVYGDAKRWPEIYEANKEVIGDNPNLIYPGQKLRIP